MLKQYIYFVLVMMGKVVLAQNDVVVNAIFDENIMTVQITPERLPYSTLPIIGLKPNGQLLELQFDHYGPDIIDYIYTVEHCNSDWTPSTMDPSEYLDAFNEDRIANTASSFNSLTDYTHYSVILPNRNIRWNKSGNYVVKVYDDSESERQLVLVRRFMVMESLVKIDANFIRTTNTQQTNTHHEIKFNITPQKGLSVYNTQTDIKAYVVQNGWLENAIGPLMPNFSRGESLIFDKVGQVVFPAGKEFRFFDIRAFDIRGEGVKIITEKSDYFEVTLQTDESRFDRPVIFRPDANGNFVIENRQYGRGFLECDYANVLFSIKRKAPEQDKDVYVFGGITDWQLKPEYKMQYSPEAQAYYCEAFLKQGYYNYQYAVLNRETNKIDEDGLEGNWYETQNTYTILTYYRPQGARYDRLIGQLIL